MREYIAGPGEAQIAVEICVVKSPGSFGYQSIYNRREAEESSDMTRISDYESVLFLPRSAKEFIPEMVAKIDEEIRQTRIRQAESIQALENRRRDLLSLTYDSKATVTTLIEDDIPF